MSIFSKLFNAPVRYHPRTIPNTAGFKLLARIQEGTEQKEVLCRVKKGVITFHLVNDRTDEMVKFGTVVDWRYPN